MRVLAIDPGITSGYVYAELSNERLEFYPFQDMDEVSAFWDRLTRFQPYYIVMEDFEFRRGTYAGAGGGGLELFPRELIGVAKLYAAKSCDERRLFLQTAAQGKSYYTDKVLKELKLYRRGVPHGMDATRHLLQWLTYGYGYQYLGKNKIEDFAVMTDLLSWTKEFREG